MRRTLMVAGLILLPTLVQAQQQSYLRDAEYDYGRKQIMVADTKNASTTANLNLWKAVEDNQKRWVDVKDERELWLGRNQIYENVISLRSKDSIQKALDEQRTKLGVADPKVGFAYDPNAPKNTGYQRMGESNPYDSKSYLRYYDEKGQLKISEVRGLKADLERQSADIEKHRQRLIQSGQDVEDKYSTAIDAYSKRTRPGKIWTNRPLVSRRPEIDTSGSKLLPQPEAVHRTTLAGVGVVPEGGSWRVASGGIKVQTTRF